MHVLSRKVRFSVNCFAAEQFSPGANSFSANPCGEGLAVFLELTAALGGSVREDTGLLINVYDIDTALRASVVPLLTERISRCFQCGQEVPLCRLAEWLGDCRNLACETFAHADCLNMALALNPRRNISIGNGDTKMFCFSEKFEFAATHRLWNATFTDQENLRMFGKCANPGGHGHNYVVEIRVKIPAERGTFAIAQYQQAVADNFLSLVDHKNLNADLDHFKEINPTVENIARFAFERLDGRFSGAELAGVCVWENDRTCCTYAPDQA